MKVIKFQKVFIAKETIDSAINRLAVVKIGYTGKSGNIDLLAFFLILKRLGVTEHKWITKSKLYLNKALTIETIYQLGGVFDSTEEAKYRGCLFFTSFSKFMELKETDFFNQKTIFKSLPSRLKDTVDNSVADYILDKGMEDSYRFNIGFKKVLRNNYDSKFPLDCLLVWIYRHTDIQNLTLYQLRELFFLEYKINEADARDIFDFKATISLNFDENPIKGDQIRKKLNCDTFSQISKITDGAIFEFNKTINGDELKKRITNMIISEDKINELLEKNGNVILTGVPGTGKSYLINEIAKNYQGIKKIQFHQNYTYQQFILGKIIKGGDVEYENGELLNFLDEVKSETDTGKKFLLFLDEINRGNISSIFGEALYILDRGNKITLPTGYELTLPTNLHVIGTMNTSDRSIALIDFAIRRRFFFAELVPNYTLIDSLNGIDGENILGSFLEKLNKNIVKSFENEDYILGHSYFLEKDKLSSEDVYNIIHFKIIPMLIEYAQGNKETIREILPSSLLNANSSSLIAEIKAFIDEETN